MVKLSRVKAAQALAALQNEQDTDRAKMDEMIGHSRQVMSALQDGMAQQLDAIASRAQEQQSQTRGLFQQLIENERARVAMLEKMIADYNDPAAYDSANTLVQGSTYTVAPMAPRYPAADGPIG